MCTNTAEWFSTPEIIPNIATVCTVLRSPKNLLNKTSQHWYNSTNRSNDRNGINLLAQALINFDWSSMEQLNDIDSEVDYSNNTICSLLNTFYLLLWCAAVFLTNHA